MVNRFYFAENGSYGDARHVRILNTQFFTPDDWQDLDDCPSETRLALAELIYLQRNKEQDVVEASWVDVPEHLAKALTSVREAMAINDKLHVSDLLSSSLAEIRIAINDIISGLALTETLNCMHDKYVSQKWSDSKNVLQCVKCGAFGIAEVKEEDK